MLNDFLVKQSDIYENTPDEYCRGMFNGMEELIALIECREAEFMQPPENEKPTGYKARVKHEKKELDAKVDKLGAFIHSDKFKAVATHERQRLVKQLNHMQGYSNILADRIKA